MSNGRRLRRAAERRAAFTSARLEGCICDPTIRHGHRDAAGVQHMDVGHDAWCPLADGRPGWLGIVFYDKGCR